MLLLLVESEQGAEVVILLHGDVGDETESGPRIMVFDLMPDIDAHGIRRGGRRRPPSYAANGEITANDALDIVATHVEVGHRIDSPELDRCDIIRLRRLFLRT